MSAAELQTARRRAELQLEADRLAVRFRARYQRVAHPVGPMENAPTH